MAVGSRGQNTMVEGLQRMLSDISQIKTTPDADLEFLIGLETMILGKLRSQIDAINGQSQQQPMPPGAGQPPPGAAPGGPQMMPGGGAPIPGIVGGGVPNVSQSPGLPNPDELRRLLTGNGRPPG